MSGADFHRGAQFTKAELHGPVTGFLGRREASGGPRVMDVHRGAGRPTVSLDRSGFLGRGVDGSRRALGRVRTERSLIPSP